MNKLRIFTQKRRGKEQWFVAHKKEVLSGPWKTMKEAVAAKMEWKF